MTPRARARPGTAARVLPPSFWSAVLGLPMAGTLLLSARAWLQPDCPWPQLPGATLLGPLGWGIGLIAALLYASPWTGHGKRRYAWATLAGVLLGATGNFHTLQPYTCAYVALMLLYAHLGRSGTQAGLAGLYLLAGIGKLNPRFAGAVPAFFAQPWADSPLHGALWMPIFVAVLLSPLLELLTATLLAFRPRLAPLLMCTIHIGVLICLIRLHWGPVVWIWNLQLLLLALGTMWETPAAPPGRTSRRRTAPKPAVRPPPAWTGLAVAAVIGLPYTLGLSNLPVALPLYTGNTNTLTLRLPGGDLVDASSDAVLRTGSGLSLLPAGLRDYAACQRRQGRISAAHLNFRWSLLSGSR